MIDYIIILHLLDCINDNNVAVVSVRFSNENLTHNGRINSKASKSLSHH